MHANSHGDGRDSVHSDGGNGNTSPTIEAQVARFVASLCPTTAPSLHRAFDENFVIIDNLPVIMNHSFINNNAKELADWMVAGSETPGKRKKPLRVVIAGQVCLVMSV